MAMHGSGERTSDTNAELAASFPLTRRQSLFWLDHKLFPRAPYHQVVLLLHLDGPLDEARFASAYRETVRALDCFRLTFVEEQGRPRQRLAEADLTLEQVDLRRRAEELDRYVGERCTRPLDLSSRAFESALVRTGEQAWTFYLCQHHLICDGVSIGYFLDDLALRYRGALPPERPSYLRYVADELAYRASPRAARDAQHYQRKLALGVQPLRLYGRRRQSRSVAVDRSYIEGGRTRWLRLAERIADPRIELLDPSLSRLVALATVQFAYLARVSGERALLVGMPIPNRRGSHVAASGLVMEQAFLRVTFDEDETFATLAAKVRRELVDALRHGRHCVSDRGLSYATLNLLRLPEPAFGSARVRVEVFPAVIHASARGEAVGDERHTFGVHLLGFERDETLRIGFDFHRETFAPALQARARKHFVALLDALLDDPENVIEHVCLVDEEQRGELLRLARGREPKDEPEDPLARLLHTAHARADHVAVRFADTNLTYGELVAQVGGLARRLLELGVRRGSRVAMSLARGPSELVTMLAAWAVGAAYVPTDPTHPPARLRLILEDARPDLLVSSSEVLGGLSVPSNLRVLDWDRELPLLAHRQPYFDLTVDGGALAYVLFTSGSTGRPKGVAVSRGAFANLLRAMAHAPGMAPSDRLLAVTTTAFDIAGLELHLPLWVGGSIEIADRDTARDPARLRIVLEREPITIMQATPTTWRLLLEAGYTRSRPLRMLCGGEALSEELATRLLPHGELWNLYGPTETTVWSTRARIESARDGITIGRPIDRTRVYVLDACGELLPVGVAGELYIGGAGLADGYLHRDDLTASRFVERLGSRLYRTGDLARMREDGALEFLGRRDYQLKVRGFRVEPGEIEACLRKHTAVRDAVVVARPAASGESSLVAYYVGSALPSVLRAHARTHLPSALCPTAYVALEELPLDGNGKIDRTRLPEPDENVAVETGLPPASDDEVQMAALFAQVLETRDVPVDRDFFELGGNSVTLLELRRGIQQTFGVELPLFVLFDAPTVQRLVEKLAPSLDPLAPAFVCLRRGPRDEPPLLCLMGVVLYRPLAEALTTDRAVYGMHIPQRVGGAAERPTVEGIATRYVELILQRVPRGPYHLTGLCFGGIVAYEVARQLRALGHDVGIVAILDGALPRAEQRPSWEQLAAAVQHAPAAVRGALRGAGARCLERLRVELSRRVREAPNEAERELDVLSPMARSMLADYDRKSRRLDRGVIVFRARERAERTFRRPRWDLGWAELARDVSVYEVEGGHLAILQPPHVQRIAAVLSRTLGGGSLPREFEPPTEKKESWMATLLDSLGPKALSLLDLIRPRRMLQVSHVKHEDLTDAPIQPEWVLAGTPRARVKQVAEASDERVAVALWDCTAGTFNWHFGDDEFVHILIGEVIVTDVDGSTRTLRPGDTAYFPKGMQSVWHVPEYVKKLAVFRQNRPPLTARARRKLGRILRAVKSGARAESQ